jgi:ribosomal protein S18 acetylase RimI-like enzyme
MKTYIRSVCEADIEAVAQLSLGAWAPTFQSFEEILGRDIYRLIWPEWQASQRKEVEDICQSSLKGGDITTWAAICNGEVTGFLACKLNREAKLGEVEYLAVDPNYRNHGIGTALNLVALEHMKAAGMNLAQLGTGGDDSHAAARRCYEKAGYTALPLVRYYKVIGSGLLSVD